MEITPAKFLVLNETTGKIHRITCKRRGDGVIALDAFVKLPGKIPVLANAAPATCCRPKDANEHIAGAQELLAHLETTAPKRAKAKRQPTDAETHSFPGDPTQKDAVTEPCMYPVYDVNRFHAFPHMGPCGHTEPHEHDEPVAKKAKRAPKPDLTQAEAEAFVASSPITTALAEALAEALADPEPLPGKKVSMTDDGHVSLQYWNAFGRDGGIGIANAVGVSSFADSRDMSLLLTNPDQERVDQAAQAIINMWVDGFAAFKVWRKTDETYKSLIRTTNVRYRAEQAWLRDYASAFAVELGGVL